MVYPLNRTVSFTYVCFWRILSVQAKILLRLSPFYCEMKVGMDDRGGINSMLDGQLQILYKVHSLEDVYLFINITQFYHLENRRS